MKRVISIGFSLTAIVLLSLSGTIITITSASAVTEAPDSSNTLVVGLVIPAPTSYFFNADFSWVGGSGGNIPYLAMSPFTSSGNDVPELTHVPQVVPGSGGLDYIINLVSANMVWSDGFPINASDLYYSIDIFLSHGPYANESLINGAGVVNPYVDNVTIVNSTAIEVTLFKPNAIFPTLIGNSFVYPWHYFSTHYTGKGVFQSTPVLSGPGDSAYLPVNYTANSQSMLLEINPTSPEWQFHSSNPSTAEPYVLVDFFTSQSALDSALVTGEIDLGPITQADIPVVNASKSIQIVQTVPTTRLAALLATSSYPWNNTQFRQALLYLINKQQIESTIYDNQTAIGNAEELLPQDLSTYLLPGAPTYNYSTSEAISLLKSINFTQNSNGQWIMGNGQPLPSITITTSNDDPNHIRAAQIIVNDFASVGIQASVTAITLGQLSILTGEQSGCGSVAFTNDCAGQPPYQIALAATSKSPNPLVYGTNQLNWPNWNNSAKAQMYAILANASAQPTLAAALPIAQQGLAIVDEQAVVEDLVYVPTYVAGNNASFTGWQTPVNQNANYHRWFETAATSEWLLTSIRPVAAGTVTASTTTGTSASIATSSASSIASTSSTSSSSSSSSSTSVSVYYIAVVATAMAVLLVASSVHRRGRARTSLTLST